MSKPWAIERAYAREDDRLSLHFARVWTRLAGQPRRGSGSHGQARGLCGGAGVTLAVPVASGAPTHTSAVDSMLVGKWTRKITKADVARAPGALILLAGKTAAIVVAKSGHFAFDEGIGGNLGKGDGAIVPAGPHRIHINYEDGAPPNLYRWHVSGGKLTLTKLRDPNPNSVAIYSGVWKRK